MEKEKETLDENITEETSNEVKDNEAENTKAENIETEETVEEANEQEAEDTETSEESEDTKKKFFKKKDKKDKKDQQIEELNDKYQRLFAEFQNYRNRSEKEKTAMYEVAKAIIEKILPVVDNFERGVAALSEEDLDSPVGQGMNLIYKQMTAALEDMGVTVIEAEGKEFDPELHNAVMHEDNEELGENMVSQELQKGYKYRDSVVRHSMVKVAN